MPSRNDDFEKALEGRFERVCRELDEHLTTEASRRGTGLGVSMRDDDGVERDSLPDHQLNPGRMSPPSINDPDDQISSLAGLYGIIRNKLDGYWERTMSSDTSPLRRRTNLHSQGPLSEGSMV